MNKMRAISKTSLFALLFSLSLMLVTAILLGKSVGLMLICIVSIVGGLAVFLKTKELLLKIAGIVFFGLGLFWLLISPFWL